jgi:hypothetical protein
VELGPVKGKKMLTTGQILPRHPASGLRVEIDTFVTGH